MHIDPILLQQAIGQILDNAVKYSASGATIRLTVQKHDDHVTISIADWGEGLTEDEKARLGERFFRGSRHTPTISGSGLGLWIAQAFVGAIGGTIAAVSSGRGQGTTVTITLPIPEQPAPDQVKELDE